MGQLRDLTILLSAAGSPSMPGGLACYRSNGERNVRIIGMDMADDPSVRYMVDVFYKVPPATAANYCDIVLDICIREKVDVYIPTISAEVSAVSARLDEFESLGVKVSVSNMESVEISNNKLHTYQTLEKAGIPVPRYYGVHSIEDFVELKSATQLEEMMLVECMHNPEFTVDLLADHGKVLYEVGRENVVSLMSIAQESVLKYDELAYKISADVVALLKMDGNVGFDFMRNEKEEAVLMDINPRLTATVSVIAAGGVNLPYLRIKQLIGEPLPKCEPVYGTRIKRRYGEYYSAPDGSQIFLK